MIEIKIPLTVIWVKANKKRYPRIPIPNGVIDALTDISENPFLNCDIHKVNSTWRISEGKIVIILEKMEG